jgi:hypothetical protein
MLQDESNLSQAGYRHGFSKMPETIEIGAITGFGVRAMNGGWAIVHMDWIEKRRLASLERKSERRGGSDLFAHCDWPIPDAARRLRNDRWRVLGGGTTNA